MASLAILAEVPLEAGIGPDSQNLLPALMGESETGRAQLVTQSVSGTLALINGDWKYIPPNDRSPYNLLTATELGNAPEPQLYNLAEDAGERVNRAADYPERVAEMAALFAFIADAP